MKEKSRVGIWLMAACAVALAAGGIWWCLRPPATPPRAGRQSLLTQSGASKSAIREPSRKPINSTEIARVKNKKGKNRNVIGARRFSKGTDVYCDENGKAYPPADQKLMSRAAASIEEDDIQAAREVAQAALSSSNKELRLMAIDALGWRGEENLVELLSFISDRDSEVASKAKDEWMTGLQQVEADGDKAWLIKASLTGLRDKDMIEDVAGELVGIDRLAAIQVIADLMDAKDVSPATTAAAKEAYNTITGDDWSDIDAAENWLQKNYVSEE